MEKDAKVVRVREVPFHGDKVTVIERNGDYHVAMKPLCERLGLEWSGQFRRIKRDPVLSSTVAMMTMVAEDGKEREVVALPLSKLNGWLFRLDLVRYSSELREKLIVYQRECYEVLHERFFGPEGDMAKRFHRTVASLRKDADLAIRAAQDAAEAAKRSGDPMLKLTLGDVEARVMFLLELLERGKGPLNLNEVGTEGLKLNLCSILDEVVITTRSRHHAA
jgi:hypothetical protein